MGLFFILVNFFSILVFLQVGGCYGIENVLEFNENPKVSLARFLFYVFV